MGKGGREEGGIVIFIAMMSSSSSSPSSPTMSTSAPLQSPPPPQRSRRRYNHLTHQLLKVWSVVAQAFYREQTMQFNAIYTRSGYSRPSDEQRIMQQSQQQQASPSQSQKKYLRCSSLSPAALWIISSLHAHHQVNIMFRYASTFTHHDCVTHQMPRKNSVQLYGACVPPPPFKCRGLFNPLMLSPNLFGAVGTTAAACTRCNRLRIPRRVPTASPRSCWPPSPTAVIHIGTTTACSGILPVAVPRSLQLAGMSWRWSVTTLHHQVCQCFRRYLDAYTAVACCRRIAPKPLSLHSPALIRRLGHLML